MPPSHETLIEQVNKLFKYYDEDESGYIEKKEMDKLVHDLALELRVRKGISGEKLSTISANMDKQFVGRVTRD